MVNSQKIRYAFFRKRFCSISYALAKKLRQRKGLLEWLEEARKHAISLDRLRIRFDPLELPFTGLNKRFESKKQMFSFLQERFCDAEDLAALEDGLKQQKLDADDVDIVAWKRNHCYLSGKLFAAFQQIHSRDKKDFLGAAKPECLKHIADAKWARFAEAFFTQTRIVELLDKNPGITAAEVISRIEELSGANAERTEILNEHIEELKRSKK